MENYLAEYRNSDVCIYFVDGSRLYGVIKEIVFIPQVNSYSIIFIDTNKETSQINYNNVIRIVKNIPKLK
ncbi:MAG: hypothetical protein MJH09_01590 [Cetobacterium sp.]|uniref:Uncharacterized protein n=1 Tax=Cetobacterium ceti TaxID=180163 RepID=A0A1T4P7F6_9FUSO|nr:hypothetical protein [Cetobacterium ceti]MCJ8341533.1 hypothetical protein [Cetobacterium sp.]SJZ87505.1 hypothetical protein SAMN02745174_01812 [Cetobacterium ceti]